MGKKTASKYGSVTAVHAFWALDEGFSVLGFHYTNPRFYTLLGLIPYAFPTPEVSNPMVVSGTK